MKELLLISKGRVQGVGYRWFVKGKADNLGIKGYVMNLSNGDVEILAQGENEQLKKFMKEIKVNNKYGIDVKSLLILKESQPKKLFQGFFIRRE